MSTLTSRVSNANIVISLGKNDIGIMNKLDNYFKQYLCTYAYILHNHDINKNGELKTPHIHVVIFGGARKRLSTFINDLSNFLDISPFAISIEKVVSLEGSIQYLIHKNDFEKYQYDKKEIITNITSSELDLFLNTENGSLTFDRLFFIIRGAKNKIEVMEKIGISYYQHYRGVINDIWNDYK